MDVKEQIYAWKTLVTIIHGPCHYVKMCIVKLFNVCVCDTAEVWMEKRNWQR